MSQDVASRWVIDASMAMAWVVERRDPRERQMASSCLTGLGQVEALVPDFWHLELANSLNRGERAGALTAQTVQAFSDLLDSLPLETDTTPIGPRRAEIQRLARKHGLTTYDTLYLDLARRHGATLATFDRQLADACRAAGVRVHGDSDHAVHEVAATYHTDIRP